MKKCVLIFSFLFFFCNVYCQNFAGCIEIDFEAIPNQQVEEGMAINTQYLASHGIEFQLEDGTSPILAQVGGTATAFGSVYGNDQPEPGSNIGSFFLTDNGVLAGLQMIPVIVNFQTPVDSFSTCVLDIDFDEFFIIQARGENGEALLTDTITSGEVGTGDGVATCWGFNFDGCEGSVYSIRFEGHRMQAGAFGLGLDNFSFCFAGIDIANNLVVDIQDLDCEQPTGSVSLINIGEDDYLYSLDGITYQTNPFFDGLAVGLYTIFIRDADGCEAELEFQINDFLPLEITNVDIEHTDCGEDNGSIQLTTSYSNGVIYSIDNMNFQDSPAFDQLAADDYLIVVIDEEGCDASTEVTINEGIPPLINNIQIIDPSCDETNGEISFQAIGGAGQLVYLLNDQYVQFTGVYTQLAPEEYTLIVVDSYGCSDSAQVSLPIPICPVFIPNVFSPNFDGRNDYFKIFTHSKYDVEVLKYQIFDRWGELVWKDENFTILTARKNWWDGSFRGQPATQGVYVYLIEVEHSNGIKEVFSGGVTLIR